MKLRIDKDDRHDQIPDYVFVPGRVELIMVLILLGVVVFYALLLGLTR